MDVKGDVKIPHSRIRYWHKNLEGNVGTYILFLKCMLQVTRSHLHEIAIYRERERAVM